MANVKIILAASWASVMLIYLLGDVLRIYSGDFKAGEGDMAQFTKPMFLGIAALMMIPALMVFLSVALEDSLSRGANLVVAIFFFGFNLIGLPTYKSAYDKFLLAVSMVVNVFTVIYAWQWVIA